MKRGLFLFLFILSKVVSAQTMISDEVILRLMGPFNYSQTIKLLAQQNLKLVEVISKSMNMVLAKTSMPVAQQLQILKKTKGFLYSQGNHLLSLRSPQTQDDPFIDRQWNLKVGSLGGVNFLDQDISPSYGVDFGGHDVVVAVIDAGFQWDHVDLQENIWVNKNEIPNNKIDDDNNGYIDDIYGWNAYKNTGKLKYDVHGTHVLGILGAVGNNKIGITGINSKIKMMLVMGATEKTSTLIKAYSYVLEQKKLWIQTSGKRGANIVATNSSFGVDKANCLQKDFPVWNEMYNRLGEVGILSAVATINDDINVDEKGDVPSGCSSEFIISVTNTNKKSEKFKYAGYGKKQIDLGAPGEDIFSTYPRNSYAYLTGTSMSTPHVAGMIGLLHASAGEKFYHEYLLHPGESALKLKKMILNSVDKLPALSDLTLSGGRLNVQQTLESLKVYEQQ